MFFLSFLFSFNVYLIVRFSSFSFFFLHVPPKQTKKKVVRPCFVCFCFVLFAYPFCVCICISVCAVFFSFVFWSVIFFKR